MVNPSCSKHVDEAVDRGNKSQVHKLNPQFYGPSPQKASRTDCAEPVHQLRHLCMQDMALRILDGNFVQKRLILQLHLLRIGNTLHVRAVVVMSKLKVVHQKDFFAESLHRAIKRPKTHILVVFCVEHGTSAKHHSYNIFRVVIAICSGVKRELLLSVMVYCKYPLNVNPRRSMSFDISAAVRIAVIP